MYTRNLTVKDLYATIYRTRTVVTLFRIGIEDSNAYLAASAMEELMLRGDSELIVETLNWAFEEGKIDEESPLVTLIAKSLNDSAREFDPFLRSYGEFLLHDGFAGPSEWIKEYAEKYVRVYRSGAVRKAKTWAKQHILTPDEERQLTELLEAEEEAKSSFDEWVVKTLGEKATEMGIGEKFATFSKENPNDPLVKKYGRFINLPS